MVGDSGEGVMRITFAEVAIKGVRRWKDPVTGKPRQETRKFMQTINPFNKLANGAVKNRYDIMMELIDERDEWLKQQQGS
jgi:hypothetical protein